MANVTVYVPMRDGVELLTLINWPPGFDPSNASAAAPRLTSVLDRSPYGPDFIAPLADQLSLALNHVGIRQMVRGTNASGGVFELWHDCASDGFDTISWIVAQNWSNGIVYECGTSADGIDSLAQDPAPHPALAAQFMQYGGTRGWENFFPGGAYREAFIETWIKNNVPANVSGEILAIATNEGPGPWWDMLNSSDGAAFFGAVAWPTISSSGWYDIILRGGLDAYRGLRAHSKAHVRDTHALVVDPLGHCEASALFPKNTLYGHAALSMLLALDLFANGTRSAAVPEGVALVTWYVMGALYAWEPDAPGNYWTTADDFPAFLATPLYLGSGGALGRDLPPTSSNASFFYDPSEPVITRGGSNFYLSCGPLDQLESEARPDVLVFSTGVLPAPVAISGPISVDLFVSSSANDTDFTAKLTDVYPNGSSLLLQDGIVRMRWRAGTAQTTPQAMRPGTVYAITVDLWNTSFIFNAGHRIRVDISSSNYPRFSPNPNTGVPLVTPWAPVIARNTIYWGTEETPSALWLPVVNSAQLPPFPVFQTVEALADSHAHALLPLLKKLDLGGENGAARDRAAAAEAAASGINNNHELVSIGEPSPSAERFGRVRALDLLAQASLPRRRKTGWQ